MENNLHQQINDLTRFEVDSKRIQKLERKHTPKTKVQRLRGFFIVLFSIGVLCQFLSALLASSGVLYHVGQKLNTNGLIVSVTSVCILLLIEGSKRFVLGSYHEQRLDDGEIQKISYLGILFFGCLSVTSTYLYTPFAVEFFAASPVLVSVDSINTHYNKELAMDMAVLNKELESHKTTAAAIDSASSWKGRISRKARPAYLEAVTAAKNVEIKLSEVAIRSQKNKALSIDKANIENSKIKASHKTWCYSFGSSLALVSIVLEFLFFLSIWWCEDYKRLEVTEAKAIRKMQLKAVEETGTDKKEKRIKSTETNINTPRTVITPFATAKASTIRTCTSCGTDITDKRSDAKFCSAKCRTTHHKNKLK